MKIINNIKLIIFFSEKYIEPDVESFSIYVNTSPNDHLTIKFVDESYVDSIFKPLCDFLGKNGSVNKTDYPNLLYIKFSTKEYYWFKVNS